jgi:hypothetical protein
MQVEMVIHDFENGLQGVRATNAAVRLSVGRDASWPDDRVLIVDYPARTQDPAGRDVVCEAAMRDWTSGRAVSFQVKPEHDVRISVSFMDRNRVAYTAWSDLRGGTWQTVRLAFDDWRPNPFLQPPGAKKEAPLDVSDVSAIMFAPQEDGAGRLTIRQFVVSR